MVEKAMEFDRDSDGKLDREELLALARTMHGPGGPRGPGGPDMRRGPEMGRGPGPGGPGPRGPGRRGPPEDRRGPPDGPRGPEGDFDSDEPSPN
jgi:hypothetical protein